MKQKPDPRSLIQENARRITALHDRIGETVQRRDSSPEARAEWSKACNAFHSQYDALAFPGGYSAALKKIQAGDGRAIEDALVFLEVRPWFFRSQYIRTKLTRLLKHAQLSTQQVERFQAVLAVERQRKRRNTTCS